MIFTFFLIFSGAALAATLALYARQALLVAYILLGIVLGPSVSGVVSDPQLIKDIAHIGIIFLLFLMGLDLQPQELLRMIGKSSAITLLSSLAFAAGGMAVALAWQFALVDAIVIAMAMTFSSTIVGLKLLPTRVLHHQRTGEIIISILLLQDLLAILMLLVLPVLADRNSIQLFEIVQRILALPALALIVYLVQHNVILYLMRRFDRIREYMFLMAIGWCLGIAELAAYFGLSHEIGAFLAGISLAASPIALFIVDSLKPLRDFFLVLFFVSLGAGFDLNMISTVVLPGLVLAAVALLVKPLVFRFLIEKYGETRQRSCEIGYRLGQMSEFSLLLVVVAYNAGLISAQASYLVQFATLVTFMVSAYYVVMRFPSPIALSDKLRQD